MGQTFKYIFNQGTSSNLFITRSTDQTILVIDYDPSISVDEVQEVVKNFSHEIKKLSKDWSIIDKDQQKPGQGPLSGGDGLNSDIDDMFNKLG